jgi:hypothetical protein
LGLGSTERISGLEQCEEMFLGANSEAWCLWVFNNSVSIKLIQAGMRRFGA